ncbi:MAG TPA: RnfABCDGE type electron transport complex subunit B [Phycisphaerae bacterium]|nr:RnfABCDGE type electron transport complex subunit B [Phycisphaerae bacterium]
MLLTIGLAILVMLALGVCFAMLLGWANVAWKVDVPLQLRQLTDAMPGANCGGCGYIGCAEYAEAVFRGEAPPDKCPVGGAAVARHVAEIMGIDLQETLPYRPVVHCGADYDCRLKRAEYTGERTCGAANLVAGVQGCTYGCLGFGDCEWACQFDAVKMVNGLAVIDYDKCTGCGACAKACPRHIISMVPFKAERIVVVACSSKDPGKVVRSVCTVGCIGCGICQKLNELFTVTDNLASINYDHYDAQADFAPVLAKCPRQTLIYVGKPSAKDLAAVAGEELPERVEADFKTTVDDADYRG